VPNPLALRLTCGSCSVLAFNQRNPPFQRVGLRNHPPQVTVAVLRGGNPFERVAAAYDVAARRATAGSCVDLQALGVVDDGIVAVESDVVPELAGALARMRVDRIQRRRELRYLVARPAANFT
jgi:hypothetical protein